MSGITLESLGGDNSSARARKMSPENLERANFDALALSLKTAASLGVLREALAAFAGSIALVSSFGAESIVLLHLAARIDPALPVLFLETGRHFPETLAYVDEATALLGLSDVRRIRPRAEEVARLDPREERASYDPDGCCDLRKTRPLTEALAPFTAWISGRKRFQADTRAALPLAEAEGGHIKINPLADWTSGDLELYRVTHGLPQHPLVARGYPSIGCAPCTAQTAPGGDPRAGRWRGFAKTECGIHTSGSGL